MPREEHPLDPSLVAILRGVEPDHVLDVGKAIHDAGIRAIEVPLNSPEPMQSVAKLAAYFGETCVCGAGTVLDPQDIARVHVAGGRLIVSPNTNVAVIEQARRHGMISMPGFATATEAFTAIAAGATHLKLFPAATYGPAHLKALRSVLPKSASIFAVGGVGADQVGEWIAAGAAGFGFGSELYRPEYTLDEIAARARRLIKAVQGAVRKK